MNSFCEDLVDCREILWGYYRFTIGISGDSGERSGIWIPPLYIETYVVTSIANTALKRAK